MHPPRFDARSVGGADAKHGSAGMMFARASSPHGQAPGTPAVALLAPLQIGTAPHRLRVEHRLRHLQRAALLGGGPRRGVVLLRALVVHLLPRLQVRDVEQQLLLLEPHAPADEEEVL
eukprot:gene11019-biopygen12824